MLALRSPFSVSVVQIFLVIEIVWPILLFAVLAGMRAQFPAEKHETGEPLSRPPLSLM